MARPSLPAAIAPFRGCPAGCLRVACETLLSPSAQKKRWTMALARLWLWTIPPRSALCTTLFLLQAIATYIDSLFGRSKNEIFFDMNCLACFSFTLLCWSMLMEKISPEPLHSGTLNANDFLGSQDPIWPFPLPQYSLDMGQWVPYLGLAA